MLVVPRPHPGDVRPRRPRHHLHALRQGAKHVSRVHHGGVDPRVQYVVTALLMTRSINPQMVDREGGVGLYTLKTVQLHARHCPPGPTSTTATAVAAGASHRGASFPSRPPRSYGMLLRLEPVPPTLHLTARPDLVDAPSRPSSPAAAAAPNGEAAGSRRSRPSRLYVYAYAYQLGAAPVSAARAGVARASAGATSGAAAGTAACARSMSNRLGVPF